MEQEIIKAIQSLQLNNSTKRLLNILADNDIPGRNKMIKYYAPQNQVDYLNLLKIPVSDRLPDLAKRLGNLETGKLVMAEIMKFQNCYNIIRPMSADQMAQCANSLILSAEEDYLSLEDIVIFFEGAKMSKYGKVYDRLDQQIIFEMLEMYREERHRTFMAFREEQHAQSKSVPVNQRFVSDAQGEENQKYREAMSEYMKQQYQNRA